MLLLRVQSMSQTGVTERPINNINNIHDSHIVPCVIPIQHDARNMLYAIATHTELLAQLPILSNNQVQRRVKKGTVVKILKCTPDGSDQQDDKNDTHMQAAGYRKKQNLPIQDCNGIDIGQYEIDLSNITRENPNCFLASYGPAFPHSHNQNATRGIAVFAYENMHTGEAIRVNIDTHRTFIEPLFQDTLYKRIQYALVCNTENFSPQVIMCPSDTSVNKCVVIGREYIKPYTETTPEETTPEEELEKLIKYDSHDYISIKSHIDDTTECDIHEYISAVHAAVCADVSGEDYTHYIMDLSSTNGTGVLHAGSETLIDLTPEDNHSKQQLKPGTIVLLPSDLKSNIQYTYCPIIYSNGRYSFL